MCWRKNWLEGAEECCTCLWLCLNSSTVCQQHNHRIYTGTESPIFIPMRFEIWWLSHFEAAMRSLSQMAHLLTFPPPPLCTRLPLAIILIVSIKMDLSAELLVFFYVLLEFQIAFDLQWIFIVSYDCVHFLTLSDIVIFCKTYQLNINICTHCSNSLSKKQKLMKRFCLKVVQGDYVITWVCFKLSKQAAISQLT